MSLRLYPGISVHLKVILLKLLHLGREFVFIPSVHGSVPQIALASPPLGHLVNVFYIWPLERPYNLLISQVALVYVRPVSFHQLAPELE